MSYSLKDKRVMITGASRGIGWSLAKTCAARGAHIVLVSRTAPQDAEKTLKDLGAAGVQFFSADLSLKGSIQELISKIDAEVGEIDVLVNNAGQLTGGLLEEQKFADIEKMLAVNVNALIQLTHHFAPKMLLRKSGVIVNNASVSGKMFFPCASTYAASKAAVVAFSESLRQEVAQEGVTVLTLITPGVKTEMFDEISNLYGDHLDLDFLDSIPAEEWSEEIVKAIEAEKTILWPKGSSKFGVKLAHHFPNFFSGLVKKKFHRH